MIAIGAVYLSYIAENGLPFIPTYDINVQLANADELVKNADVRIGGALVGQVLAITPEPATRTSPHPYARLQLQLQKGLEPLPSDTRYAIRLWHPCWAGSTSSSFQVRTGARRSPTAAR